MLAKTARRLARCAPAANLCLLGCPIVVLPPLRISVAITMNLLAACRMRRSILHSFRSNSGFAPNLELALSTWRNIR